MPSQPSGAASSVPTRSAVRRQNTPASGWPLAGGSGGVGLHRWAPIVPDQRLSPSALDLGPGLDPLGVVVADVAAVIAAVGASASPRTSPARSTPGRPTWNVSQWSLSVVRSQALRVRRRLAEPLRRPARCASGVSIQFIHMYMQFGFLALDEIIQVSDQPVEPSFGQHRLDRHLVGFEQVGDDLPGRAHDRVALRERGLLCLV